MIIDCHSHYTTEPASHHKFREAQVFLFQDSTMPFPSYETIGDDEIRESIENHQLRLLRARGADMTIFSPRASGMGHHIGDEAVSRRWTRASNDLIAASSKCIRTTSLAFVSYRTRKAFQLTN